jgi:hypothetical protein
MDYNNGGLSTEMGIHLSLKTTSLIRPLPLKATSLIRPLPLKATSH